MGANFIPNLLVLIKSGFVPYLFAVIPPLLIMYVVVFALWFAHQLFRETSAYFGILNSYDVNITIHHILSRYSIQVLPIEISN